MTLSKFGHVIFFSHFNIQDNDVRYTWPVSEETNQSLHTLIPCLLTEPKNSIMGNRVTTQL